MGLGILNQDIDNSSANNKAKLKETVADILGACDVAVTTLNDVLIVEKINARLLTIEKRCVVARDFISETVNMFQLQVRSLVHVRHSFFCRFDNRSLTFDCRRQDKQRCILLWLRTLQKMMT